LAVVPLPTLDPAALTAAYEALRAQVVGDPGGGRPAQGLALLYRRGLPAWLAQMTHPAAAANRSAAAGRATATTAAGATETVLVVASMVLARRAGGQP
jgi:hypothetical protein